MVNPHSVTARVDRLGESLVPYPGVGPREQTNPFPERDCGNSEGTCPAGAPVGLIQITIRTDLDKSLPQAGGSEMPEVFRRLQMPLPCRLGAGARTAAHSSSTAPPKIGRPPSEV
jgi:hypothetical protein